MEAVAIELVGVELVGVELVAIEFVGVEAGSDGRVGSGGGTARLPVLARLPVPDGMAGAGAGSCLACFCCTGGGRGVGWAFATVTGRSVPSASARRRDDNCQATIIA